MGHDQVAPAGADVTPGEGAHGSRRRRWLRRACACAAGLGLVAAAELLLALAGYGGPQAMFLPADEGDGTRSYVTNPHAFRATFRRNAAMRAQGSYPSAPAQRFPVDKPPGTYRIVVVGGSTVMGFPHRPNAALPCFLEGILNSVCHGPRFHVVNAGVAAVNSYTVRARLPELLGYGADMVVVYCGHNEFFGAYGPASAVGGSRSRTVALLQMWIDRRRLAIAAGDLVGWLSHRDAEAGTGHPFETMPEPRGVPTDSSDYGAAVANFRANLQNVARTMARAGKPIVLCVPAANLRHFPPLGSDHGPGLTPVAERQWAEQMAAAERLQADGQHQQAAASMEDAARISPAHAATHFALARALERLNRPHEAAEHYRAARDLDTVRWRAPADVLGAIRQVARADGTVVLADVEAHLSRLSPCGAPGAEFFLEHVHPTLEGNYAIAEAVARAVAHSPVGPKLGTWDWAALKGPGEYARQAGVDEMDLIIALQRAAVLRHMLLPQEGDGPGSYASLLARVAAMQQRLSPARRAAWDRTAESGAITQPDSYDRLRGALADELAARGDVAAALAEVRKGRANGSWQLEPATYARSYLVEARLLRDAGREAEAVQAAQRALALDPGAQEVPRLPDDGR